VSEQVANDLSSLAAELGQVEQEVRSAVSDLRAPFGQLVQGELRDSWPLLRGAFVLAAGSAAFDSPLLAQKRMHLAAAIEVLRLALAVHTRLLASGDSPPAIDRSLLGSTVLAGDFCFSRSAALAAKTGSPAVVDIFAQALQRVSEGTLRGLFTSDQPLFDVERELCLSGVAAANELAGVNEQERRVDLQLAAVLLEGWRLRTLSQVELPPPFTGALPPQRSARWRALLGWLNTHEARQGTRE
jgi:octaprenyl-diphosphate synthase